MLLTVEDLLYAILNAKRLEQLQAEVRDAMIAQLMAQSTNNPGAHASPIVAQQNTEAISST